MGAAEGRDEQKRGVRVASWEILDGCAPHPLPVGEGEKMEE